jgi:CRISPR-associated protein Csd1
LAYWFEDELASIAKSIDSEPPTTLDLTEQTLFALGYYQQMAKLRPPKKAKTRENNENAPSADEKENN